MKRIGDNLDSELFVGPIAAPVALPGTEPNAEMNAVRGLAVIQALLAAGKKSPFDFDLENAKKLWGVQLAPFTLDQCMEGALDYINAEGDAFPSIGDLIASIKFNIAERLREDRTAERGSSICTECDGVHWVRQLNDVGSGHHMMPCPACPEMRERYELYCDGHFHVDHEPCWQCMKYRDYPRWKAREKANKRAATTR